MLIFIHFVNFSDLLRHLANNLLTHLSIYQHDMISVDRKKFICACINRRYNMQVGQPVLGKICNYCNKIAIRPTCIYERM